MPARTLTLVFSTERGTPDPLTLHRCKAAVPFGGKYRVIDFTLANCLHSGLRQVLILTQYKSHSLHKHLRDGWSLFSAELGEFITAVPPQMRDSDGWYTSALDGLRQNRYLLNRSSAEDVLLLDGGLVYRMDYAELIAFHREQRAGLTCAARMVRANTPAAGTELTLGSNDAVEEISVTGPGADAYIAPMGVYLIRRDLLLAELDRLLERAEQDLQIPGPGASSASEELAHSLVAPILGRHPVHAYHFGGERGRVTPDRYWSDLASTDAYFRANMALLEAEAPLDLYQPDWNILTHQGQYPPARTVPGPSSGNEGVFVNSMLAAGTVIRGGGVSHSVLFPRVEVEDGAIVDEAILFDRVHVGAGAHLRRCILDKEVVVTPGARIGFDPAADAERFDVSPDGIVVVGRAQVV
jgi:glucose-1-phosphate adenylyltransferase